MKLPFNIILRPILKPYLGRTRVFCHHPTFSMSVPYTYFYGILGFVLSANHLRKHLGESPTLVVEINDANQHTSMLLHDLKIVATSMGLVQYTCVIVGCITENPALFLPHLFGQLIIVTVKILNALLLLAPVNFKQVAKLIHKVPAIMLLAFNWLQEFCVFRQFLCICDFRYHECTQWLTHSMETESNHILNQLRLKHENHPNLTDSSVESSEAAKIRLRTLLVALLGMSMSACAFASQPVELELEDDDVAQRLNNVSFARRITKPTIRLVMGYSKLSAFVTAISSLLLLVAVMSKQSWWRRGARWLAAPALLVAALEAASDASDAMLAAALRGTSDPSRVAGQTAAAGLLVTAEILVWYFIAKFFEYSPPSGEDREKENQVKALPM